MYNNFNPFFAYYNYYANPKHSNSEYVSTGDFKSDYINTGGMILIGTL